MRLRLSVQRNNLPITNLLWNVPGTNSAQAYTIARLLEDVNLILPLEAEQWGLEDYLVELDGFECLHFSSVFQTLKEDDHVSIRPLLTAEVRSRTLCGRYQISEGGQHLVDGIPFGRPYLRQPNRPSVRIPPRKRRRLEEDAIIGAEATKIAGLITNGENLPALSRSMPLNGVAKITPEQSRSGNDKTVHFEQANADQLEDSEEEDGEFAPEDASDVSEVSVDSISDSEIDVSSDDSDTTSESDSDSDSDSDSVSDSDVSSSAPEEESTTVPKPKIPLKRSVPPGQGSKDTKQRNRRRADSLKLKQMKQAGKMHQNATLEDYRRYTEGLKDCSSGSVYASPAKPMSTATGKRKRLDEEAPAEPTLDESAELARRKQELIKMLGEEAPAPAEAQLTPTPIPAASRNSSPVQKGLSSGDAVEQVSEGAKERPVKRLRPDVSAIGRMLAHQTKTVERKKTKKPAAAAASPEPEGASDPDFWKTRLNLSAFECWDEEHELSAPPFPFKQHWDSASRLMRDKTNKNKKKPAKENRATRSSPGPEKNTTKLILDYDDSPDTVKQDSDTTTTAIESQLIQDVQAAAKSDLPSLPEDVDALPALESADVKVGAIIVFKLWVINPATVTPEFSEYKTAVVEKEGDSGSGAGTFKLKLAERDIPKKEQRKVDDEGNRVYDTNDGFQMDSDEDENDNDSSVFEGTFTELVTPKLLKAAA